MTDAISVLRKDVSPREDLAPLLGRQGRLSDEERRLLADAYDVLPGGALGGNALPDDVRFVFHRGKGARFWDTSGNEYIDYCLGSGPLVLGHAHPAVINAVADQATRGTHFFAYLNEPSVRLATRVVASVPCAEKLRFTTSGSDATFHAIRLARAFTNRDKILKFEGAYHGHHDYSQLSTSPKAPVAYPQPQPDTSGIPQSVRDLMLVAPYNDLESTRAIVEKHAKEIAAIIVEPVQRIIAPVDGFLAGLRELTEQHGIVLIFDEVVTGFRFGMGGAQTYFGVKPDLCTLGKIIGGGTPVGAVVGRADILDQCDPRNKGEVGYVYQNGTLNGNPLGSAVAMAVLDELEKPGTFETLFDIAERARREIGEVLAANRIPAICFGMGPMWHILFTEREPRTHRDVMAADGKALMRFDQELIRNGIFVLPANRRFVSLAHGDRDIADTLVAVDRTCRKFKETA